MGRKLAVVVVLITLRGSRAAVLDGDGTGGG